MASKTKLVAWATLLVAVLVASDGIGGGLEQVKFDISALSESYKKNLTLELNIDAYFEAYLEFCGVNPDLEGRATEAAKACLTSESIAKITAFYRQQKAFMAKSIVENQAKYNIVCTDDVQKKEIQKAKKLLDDEVGRIADACSKCMFC
jgi:hypothetical protein